MPKNKKRKPSPAPNSSSPAVLTEASSAKKPRLHEQQHGNIHRFASSDSQSQALRDKLEKARQALESAVSTCLKDLEPNDVDFHEAAFAYFVTHHTTGRDMLVTATTSVVNNFVSSLQNWQPHRPILYALLDTLDRWNLKVGNKEISLRTGVSKDTVSVARFDMQEVRVRLPRLVWSFSDLFVLRLRFTAILLMKISH